MDSRLQRRTASLLGRLVAVVALLPLAGAPARALTFNFLPSAAVSANPQILAAAAEAGALWSSIFTDDITVNLALDLQPLGFFGPIAFAQSVFVTTGYDELRNALTQDARSPDDLSAVAHLQTTSAVRLLTNRTGDNPNGAASPLPYLDDDGGANNTTVRATKANLKALGFTGLDAQFGALDALLVVNADLLPFADLDRSDGIDPGKGDAIGVGAHEIGHALGFISGVDRLDAAPGQSDDAYRFNPLDLFRYSAESVALGSGVFDFTADDRAKYFSLDGGATGLVPFSTGINFGDGLQASHWKDDELSGVYFGVMDPRPRGPGFFLSITENDVRAFDVIGYDLAPASVVPEPGTLVLLAVGLPAGMTIRRRRGA